ncbi:uncharacterized protein SPPG_04076 [Spizellomyces punctatus DAOM BR117]|uniref:Uncharacterized protein n=1 Tax=Spizellomyces punctatus (strain DAOM BR117) TaxID=645134 RepID=A0A0L0HIW9_SPIPD|nr:uncharacterized protein SPPG_04076 [Spizellomyces punctatus DAOM BR117]KND00978.1 hypothetical protein SPPG_04076 [Spizellomyces punctatus DAOM BR117]|eukprot:XP_016609017.1 hypothetical protein SPPG_04076 [Spizellomyces punctatus DAOM BR117]
MYPSKHARVPARISVTLAQVGSSFVGDREPIPLIDAQWTVLLEPELDQVDRSSRMWKMWLHDAAQIASRQLLQAQMTGMVSDTEAPTLSELQDAGEKEWKSEYDHMLTRIADSCELEHPWPLVKEVIKLKIRRNLKGESEDEADKGDSVKDYETRIGLALDTFDEAPFTVQRLCELTVRPNEHHKNVWKYLRALEKVLLVTSSDSPLHFSVIRDSPMEIVQGNGVPSVTEEKEIIEGSPPESSPTAPTDLPTNGNRDLGVRPMDID